MITIHCLYDSILLLFQAPVPQQQSCRCMCHGHMAVICPVDQLEGRRQEEERGGGKHERKKALQTQRGFLFVALMTMNNNLYPSSISAYFLSAFIS